jgi:hypothetical protein
MDELDAMRAVASALDALPDDVRARIIAWAASRYGVRGIGGFSRLASPQDAAGDTGSGPSDGSEYSTFAEFFDAADPQTESEKALVAGYWLQKRQGMATFDSATVNRELKHLGHAVKNITSAFNDLIELRPALAVQTAKAGKSQQARKKYMITKAGEKLVHQRLAGSNTSGD